MLEMILQIGNQTVDKQAVLGITDEFGRSLLMQGVTINNAAASKFLLQYGVDVDWGGTSYSNKTPLMQAACAGNKELCKLLLEHGADPTLKDRFGRVVSEQAAMLGKQDVVKLLDSYEGAAAVGGEGAGQEEELVEVDEDTQRLVWRSLVTEVPRPAPRASWPGPSGPAQPVHVCVTCLR
jgi:hypothetical protein